MWFTGYCCGVNGARTAATGHGDDGRTDRAGMGCTPSILSNGSNNQQQQQSRKDSGLYVGNVASAVAATSGNGSSESNAANNNKLGSHGAVNATMVNASYPGAGSKDGGTEKESAKKDSIVSISATGHITSFPVVSTTVRRPTAGSK
ncbi:AGAP007163-PA-like protein [Anopheles sinensis]|uniref:AGAP007163-PA-like protein n=1 Tax=Anopheles sinensis TaxID=74873 RepID=A0A084VQY8_ANOSI|nr:AGAP007163-PA-like protein [Anopheles sinensis]